MKKCEVRTGGRYEEKEQVFTQQAVISAQHLHSQQKERSFENDN